ncbi:MAG: hypothetical protein ACUVYA_12515 [Planctomycetota bacterium]
MVHGVPRILARRSARLAGRPLLAAGAFLALASQVFATIVAPLDFGELHRRSGRLFHGRCVSRREVFDGGTVPHTEYVFEVVEGVKGCRGPDGAPAKTVAFRHAGTRSGAPRPDGLEVPPLRLGVPEYEPGEEVVLFLTREAPSGLCAPVGLAQGVFRVKRSEGKATVRAPFGGRRLFAAVRAEAFEGIGSGAAAVLRDRSDEIPLETFLELCRRFRGSP